MVSANRSLCCICLVVLPYLTWHRDCFCGFSFWSCLWFLLIVQGLNVYSILQHDTLVMSVGAIRRIEERLHTPINRWSTHLASIFLAVRSWTRGWNVVERWRHCMKACYGELAIEAEIGGIFTYFIMVIWSWTFRGMCFIMSPPICFSSIVGTTCWEVAVELAPTWCYSCVV